MSFKLPVTWHADVGIAALLTLSAISAESAAAAASEPEALFAVCLSTPSIAPSSGRPAGSAAPV